MSEQGRGVRRFVERATPRRAPGHDGFVIAAGKGGVGTSTAALLLAFAARRQGSVVLVDAQEGLGGLGPMSGAAPFRADSEEPRARQVTLAEDLELVLADPGAANDPGRRSALRRAVRSAGEAREPTIIVDAGSRPAGVLQALHDYGSRLVTVVGPDGVSAAAAYSLAKLAWHTRPETEVAALGARMDEAQARLAHDALRTAARNFADRTVTWLGHLPEGPSVGREPAAWETLNETEPALVRAAGVAAGRLLRPDGTRSKSTLTLLK